MQERPVLTKQPRVRPNTHNDTVLADVNVGADLRGVHHTVLLDEHVIADVQREEGHTGERPQAGGTPSVPPPANNNILPLHQGGNFGRTLITDILLSKTINSVNQITSELHKSVAAPKPMTSLLKIS